MHKTFAAQSEANSRDLKRSIKFNIFQKSNKWFIMQATKVLTFFPDACKTYIWVEIST